MPWLCHGWHLLIIISTLRGLSASASQWHWRISAASNDQLIAGILGKQFDSFAATKYLISTHATTG